MVCHREESGMKSTIFGILVILVLTLALSCAGGDTPLDVTGPDLTQVTPPRGSSIQTGTSLWGYFDFFIDPDNMSCEAVPNRTAAYSVNIVQFLNANPLGVSVSFNQVTPGPDYIDIDLDVTITHPLNNEKFDGYDVRGVFLGECTKSMQYDSDLVYPIAGPNQYLLNADGYTRWFNVREFSSPGIFGYTEGRLATKDYFPMASLNSYKYFGDGLSADENLWDYMTSGDDSVGYFLHGTSNTRNYLIRFPLQYPGVRFAYAIIADWSGGDPEFHPSHTREAVGCKIIDNSNLYYIDNTDNGGNIICDISIFDWHSELNSTVMDEYTIFIDSMVLSTVYEADTTDMTPIGGGQHFNTYHLEIPADNVNGIFGLTMFVIVEYPDDDYSNPFDVPNFVIAPLAAFFRHELEVSDENPPSIDLLIPNGGQIYYSGFPADIEWITNNFPAGGIDIFYSVDNFETDSHQIATGVPDTGLWTWEHVADDPSDTVKIRVVSHNQPSINDTSDGYFSILTPSLTLTSPNGDENWITGTAEEISWLAEGISGTVSLEYSTDDFVSDINIIVENTDEDGSYIWDPIPALNSDTVKVRIKCDLNTAFYETSDNYFSIYEPWIEVTIPNGGENWLSGTDEEITWTSSGVPGNVEIIFSTDGFGGIDDFVVSPDTENDGSFMWEDIPCFVTSNGLIMVRSIDLPLAFDTSDAPFTVTPSNAGWVRSIESENMGNLFSGVEAITASQIYSTGHLAVSPGKTAAVLARHDSCGELWRVVIQTIGPFQNDVVSAGVAVDGNNNVIICGRFEGEPDFDDDGIAEATSNGETDAFIAKYDENGNFLDVYTWGGTSYDACTGVAADTGGGIYACGYFQGDDVDFDPGAGEVIYSSNGYQDVFLTKFNVVGMHQFTHVWGGEAPDIANDVQTDGANVYVSGSYEGQVDFDPTAVIEYYTSNGYYDAFLSRYTVNGSYMWSMVWGGASGYDAANDVAIDSAGSAYTTGYFAGTVDFSPHEWEVDNRTSIGLISDTFVSVISMAGVYDNAYTWGARQGNAIDIDGLGNVLVCGEADGSIDFNPEGGGTLDANGAFMSKFDSGMNWQWSRVWDVYFSDIDADVGLNIYSSGFFMEAVEFATTGDPCYDDSIQFDTGDGSAPFLMKLLPDGCM